jgi:hypothetical protein
MQMKSSGVQAVIHGEDRNVNNVYNTDHLLITCDKETDIVISKSTKDTIWNLVGYLLVPLVHQLYLLAHALGLGVRSYLF